MTEPLILDPLAGDRAFRDQSVEAPWSQAAQLIGLGVQLRGDSALLEPLAPALERLRVPRVPQIEPISPATLVTEAIRGRSQFFFLAETDYAPAAPWSQAFLWDELARSAEPDPVSAVALLYASLFSQHEINRVAAAVTLQPLLTELPSFIHRILVDGCFSDAETIRHLAADALARFDPENPTLLALTGPEETEIGSDPAHTSTVIHGTWARWRRDDRKGEQWWEPGSKFFKYIRNEVSADLYAGDHYFRWSGGYHDQDRTQGAEGLRRWCAVHHVSRFDVLYAHSYGATVGLLASMSGEHYPPIRARVAMLLSAPAVVPPGCDCSGFTRVLSLRSVFDFVLIMNRTIGSFPAPIEELRAPIPPWYGHGATHNRLVWRRLGIARELKFELNNTPWGP